MQVFVFLVTLLVTLTKSRGQILNGTFVTNVDHFRPQNTERVTFYFEANYRYFEYGGPYYIYIKDARNNTFQWLQNGLMLDIAEETNAALFTFSHRYFGVNRPTENVTFESLQFHTVEQNLADIATFIQYIRSVNEEYSPKIILWGSGYGGTLATWARKKYPHLIDGVWSSSGIFLTDLYSTSQYDRLETILTSVGGTACSDSVRDAFEFMQNLVEIDDREILQDRFNLCHPVDTDSMLDVAAFYESHINDVLVVNQWQHLNGMVNFCREMAAIPGEPFESFARWVNITFGSANCYDHTFTGQVERFGTIEWDTVGTNNGRRQWYYNQCTQVGLFLVASESTLWFPMEIPIDYHIERCRQLFGENYNSEMLAIANANLAREFGSTNATVTNVIFTNGALDPYLNTGMEHTRNPNTVVLTIEDYSKSADMTSINLETDTPALVEVKERIRRQIVEWSELDSMQ